MADIDECPDVELCDGSGPRNGDSGAFAIGLCFVLAAATLFGGCIALVLTGKKRQDQVLCASVSLAAGLILYIALIGLRIEGEEYMCCAVGDEDYDTFSALFMFSGVLLMAGIEWSAHTLQDYAARKKRRAEGGSSSMSKDAAGKYGTTTTTTSTTANQSFSAGNEAVAAGKSASSSAPLITNEHVHHNHHHGHSHGGGNSANPKNGALVSLGVWTCVGIALHNFPEGMAVYAAISMDGAESEVGMSLFYGILIHNIPMGMSIAMPVYAGTGSWKKAMGLCTVAAFAQPLGSLVAYGALGENLSMLFEGAMYSMLAGILLFVALIELLPNAYGLSTGSRALPGLFTFLGMGVMAVVQTQLGHSHGGHGHSHGNGTNHSHNDSVYSFMSPYDDGAGDSGAHARFARAYNNAN